ncbi:hypothetical protein SMACR_00398 [Sordaria macrospora]|uniref:WGS project CABT00000000 data, contig 2.1 n=2 Tax=Sordaria macrospora TaxID=5147 RepID=F7VL03_SORMK|nr:uncharacterized protein SMAC_00398 [Sordaria macrospora k-hell]KAA8632623.1 hypothetical protein SMACR_00398 [Sordaria macrospora]KAH7627652.1 hypothetical protein B0T09DRAFT_269618 [Sordaria sp. MPI-SDFR-AT-0083]WPJ59143.1 hypothetical protein SMAC4_00398 [Sordaria macrospora]CCC06180.1 unnamed protein product [Sordaria macrospora k-hell]
MASHAPAHLPTESESPTLRSLLSVFGAGPARQKSESVTEEKDLEDVRGQPPLPSASNIFGNVSAVTKVIWAFTKNDLFTATLPNAIFAITAAIADSHLRGEATFSEIIARFPLTYFFNFYALLIFHLGNQRPREPIAEGRVTNTNKPRRLFSPAPSGKTFTTPEQIRRAYLVLLPITLALNHFFGVWHEGLMIHLMTFIFNDLGGGNEPLVRDIILGISFGYINSASLKIALNALTSTTSKSNSNSPHSHTWTWLNLVSVLIATTIGCQEFNNKNHKDHHSQGGGGGHHQEGGGGGGGGDKSVKRKRALAIFLGEAAVPRAQLAMMMPLWTLVCAVFWRLKVPVASSFVLYSLFVASRVLTQRSVGAEERTWRFWARWTVVVYLFPLVAVLSSTD